MHDIGYLKDILILLFASLTIVVTFGQLGLSPALGYLVAGAAIGPYGLSILKATQTTKSIAEFGVVFMLFVIGLEMTLERLISMRKYVLGFGSLQMIVTALFIGLIAYKLGTEPGLAIIIGSTLAMSSTAIVLQVINENGEKSTRVARLSLAILLLQDLAVIPILVFIPLLSNPEINIWKALGGSFFNAAIALTIIFVVGRFFLKPIFRVIVNSKNEVLFLSATLALVLGSAFISNFMGLSLAFGTFVAGLMVAETEYKYRIEDEISSLKALLMGLFFMTIGMSFEFDLLIKMLPKVGLISVALILVKALIIILLCILFRFPLAPAIHAGLLLSQGSEFAFVVFIMCTEQKIISTELSQLLITVITVTMAFTPLLSSLGRKIKGTLYLRNILENNKIKREIGDIYKHIIIIGFGKIGRIVTNVIKKREGNYVVLDNNHRIVRIEKANGYNIYYGDAMNVDILNHLNIKKAETVIVAMEDDFACIKITRFIHENFPHVNLITKTDALNNVERFRKVGASSVIAKNLETGLQLGKAALISVGFQANDIEKTINSMRDSNSEFVKNIIFQDNEQQYENLE